MLNATSTPLLFALLSSASEPATPNLIERVRLPAGSFLMGCVPDDNQCDPNVKPRHRVKLTKGYYLAKFETSIAEFERFVDATKFQTLAEREMRGRMWLPERSEWDWVRGLSWKYPLKPGIVGDPRWPAVQVSWYDADAFCRWAGGRLPTEAEWEYAARNAQDGQLHVWGRSATPRTGKRLHANGPDKSLGREIPSFERFAEYDDGHAYLAPVGSYSANLAGLHDMAGNAYEWVADWVADGPYEGIGAVVEPKGLNESEIKGLRGGGWGYPPSHFRLSFRGIADPNFRTATFGFRCAWDASATQEGTR